MDEKSCEQRSITVLRTEGDAAAAHLALQLFPVVVQHPG